MPEYCENCVHRPIYTRRDFLTRLGMGIGALGLASLLSEESLFGGEVEGVISPLAPKGPPFPARAKRVLHIFAAGAPSQVDTWDPKPALAKFDGQAVGGRGGGDAVAVQVSAAWEMRDGGERGVSEYCAACR